MVKIPFDILTQKFRIYNNLLTTSNGQVIKEILRHLPREGGNSTTVAFEVRDTFERLFNSDAGSVSWRINMI